MTVLTVPVIGADVFRCQCPKTPENTYESGGKQRCRKCKIAKGSHRNNGGVASRRPTRRPATSPFCRHCEAGDCGRLHRRDDPDARCLRMVGAMACICGSQWSRLYRSLYMEKGNAKYRTGPAVGRRR